jgi:DNA-binding SARP family transcriptional activator
MSEIKIFLFGKLCIEADGLLIQKFETHKAEELLLYLLLHPGQPHARERLADLLWGEISSEQSKSYLRKAFKTKFSKSLFQCHSERALVASEEPRLKLQEILRRQKNTGSPE